MAFPVVDGMGLNGRSTLNKWSSLSFIISCFQNVQPPFLVDNNENPKLTSLFCYILFSVHLVRGKAVIERTFFCCFRISELPADTMGRIRVATEICTSMPCQMAALEKNGLIIKRVWENCPSALQTHVLLAVLFRELFGRRKGIDFRFPDFTVQYKTRHARIQNKRTSQFSPDQDVVGLVAAGIVIFATRLENVCSDQFCLSGSLRNFISEESHESRGKSPFSRRRKHNSPSTNTPTTTLPSCHPSIAVIFSCFFAGVCS